MNNPKTTISQQQKEILLKRATNLSVVTAIIIVAIKLFAWFITDSLSLLSSLIDSILDILASVLSAIAIRYSLQPPDSDHRFGHGKAEDIAAFAQGGFILGSSVFILFEAFYRLTHPVPLEGTTTGILVMLLASLLTMLLLAYQSHVVKLTNSVAVTADMMHYKTDFMINFAVIAGLLLAKSTEFYYADALIAIVIAAYIFICALKVAKVAFDKLMDKEFNNEERKKIQDVILSHEGVEGVHDLRTRYSGTKAIIQFHLELRGDQSLDKAHKIGVKVMHAVQDLFPESEVLVHHDPV